MSDDDNTRIKIKLATEEWNGLREIIRQFDNQLFIIYGWLATGLTVLTVAFVTNSTFSPDSYLVVSGALFVFAVAIALIQRVVKNRASDRVGAVEEFLRKVHGVEAAEEPLQQVHGEYDGPKITLSLRQNFYCMDLLKELSRLRVILVVLMLLGIIVVTYSFKKCEVDRDSYLKDKIIKVKIVE